eukprot:11406157-Alexandrium_andersonii.AAC.1
MGEASLSPPRFLGTLRGAPANSGKFREGPENSGELRRVPGCSGGLRVAQGAGFIHCRLAPNARASTQCAGAGRIQSLGPPPCPH